MRGLRVGILLAAGTLWLTAQNVADFEKRVSEFTLANGLHFMVVERHEAPVVSFNTSVNVGAVDDASGETGMAHLFEHMAFKGTDSIGTRDWPSEKRALDAVEDAYDRLEAEQNRGPQADAGKLAGLQAELKLAIGRADSYSVPNQYMQILRDNGGMDVGASATYDSTEYRYSLPSNRVELWFLMESQRLLHPALREFYHERDAVTDEERSSVEQSAQGRLLQNTLFTAFAAHPYRNPQMGWMSDLASLRAARAKAFFDKYYVPGNMTMTLVGDVNPADAKRLAERYFGPIAARPLPERPHTVEPPQTGPKTVEVYTPTQPFLMAAYKRPDMYDKDDPVFDVIRLLLSNGHMGLLYKQLVEQKRLAQTATLLTPFPGGRYPSLALFFVAPAPGRTVAENDKGLSDLLLGLQTTKVDEAVLARAKTRQRAEVLQQLANNAGLAEAMTHFQAGYGNWRRLFTSLDDLNKVTGEDVLRVARQYFVLNGRTLAIASARPGSSGLGGIQ